MTVVDFDLSELEIVGEFPAVPSDPYYMPYPTPQRNTPISYLENWELFFNHENPYWVPDFMNDTNYTCPAVIPDTVPFARGGGFDAFGVEWVPGDEGMGGAMPKPGVTRLETISDWEKLDWPNPSDWNWARAHDEYKCLNRERPTAMFYPSGVFERMISLTGFEEAAISFYDDPDAVHAFLDRLLEYNIEVMKLCKKHLGMDIFQLSDDWGSKQAQFLSDDIMREFMVPHVKALAETAHDLGMKFMHHSCGNNIKLVPIFIECGTDYWELNFDAVQSEIAQTVETYRDDLLFNFYFGMADAIPEADDELKALVDDRYASFGSLGSTSLTFYDYAERSFDQFGYMYQKARETAIARDRS